MTDYRLLYLCLHERINPHTIECENGVRFTSCGDPACERWTDEKQIGWRHFHKTAA